MFNNTYLISSPPRLSSPLCHLAVSLPLAALRLFRCVSPQVGLRAWCVSADVAPRPLRLFCYVSSSPWDASDSSVQVTSPPPPPLFHCASTPRGMRAIRAFRSPPPFPLYLASLRLRLPCAHALSSSPRHASRLFRCGDPEHS